jgi:hypothetical protein
VQSPDEPITGCLATNASVQAVLSVRLPDGASHRLSKTIAAGDTGFPAFAEAKPCFGETSAEGRFGFAPAGGFAAPR